VRVLTPHTSYDPAAQVNDVDQVIANQVQWGGPDTFADDAGFVWRPDLGGRRLGPPAAGCGNVAGNCDIWLEAQQPTKTWVVGHAAVKLADGTMTTHAVLWRVPAVSRAAFPKVNANPYGGTGSTVSLSANGGRYYQTYTATQTTAAGPYVEHIDWGDGTGSRRTRSSINATAAVSHLYTKTGTYWVRVYVKDAQGRWGVSERKVTVVS
jgi:hypothetical protein